MDAQLLAFVAVAAGMVALPGADFTVVVRNALASRRAGLATALGVVGGLVVHTALAAAGLAAVLVTVPVLFRSLQLLGGTYVLYLGISGLCAMRRRARRATAGAGTEAEDEAEDRTQPGLGRALRQGFLTNALNPKAPVLFLSLLPQFVPDGEPPLPRTVLLASVVVLLGLLWFPAVALLVDRLGRWLRRPRTTRAIEGGSGTALTALGLVLVTGPLLR
ncbi:LysE family translocator [Streptomyces sp. NBC_01012]|uniref:LysE family translocator n=1 Tax=Streptomyces sp. NBC_01012 TaxID=2903717 RepID=UPI00386F6610|nr:LysE family translocator [Streptomyces sp. NBC_01012]